jgi:GR25 family glycosyltransferase involved in LPS biosynthesis
MKPVLVLIFIIVVLVLVLLFLKNKNKQTLTKVSVINMDRNKARLDAVKKRYDMSDMKLPLERFSAIVGTSVNPADYITPSAIKELRETEENGYRTKHCQLTRGAIGCYLSHVELLKNIKPGEIHLILEDDIIIVPNTMALVNETLYTAPRDWDMILLGYNSLKGTSKINTFVKVKSFWGMCAYLINYKGAQKFLKETGKDFDCQIDSLMSWMASSEYLNIWALQNPIMITNGAYETDIQNHVKIIGVESFMYRDKILQL